MLSKNQTKLITSLGKKKYRSLHGFFVVEGVKSIKEFLNSDFQLEAVFTIESGIFKVDESKYFKISQNDLNKISFLSSPNIALALFKIKKPKQINTKQLIVALDGVNDPGNLGTIIRLCDWFGISDLVCSNNTVDCFNPKVVQSTMGSLARVNVSYLDLPEFLVKQEPTEIYGTFMDGDNVYNTQLSSKGVLVLGNEANGISKAVETFTSIKLAIPQFSESKRVESLNVAMATAIFLSEFKRRATET